MGFKNINKQNLKNTLDTIKKNSERLRKSPAVKYTNRTPIYCTFYNVDINESTIGEGTDDIRDDIGENSPLKFNKINDCVMFGLDEWSKNKEDDEYAGMKIERENVSVIPLGTFKPIVNSFFKLDIDDEVFLYKVTSVEKTILQNTSNYKITYESAFSDSDPEFNLIEDQVIKEFTFLYDNIGTEYKVLIENNEIIELEELNTFTQKLNNIFYSSYYDQKTNCIFYKDNGNLTYFPLLIEFLINSNTIYDIKDDCKIILTHEFSRVNNFDVKFSNSFYLKIINRETPTENDMKFTIRYLTDNDLEFNFTSLKIYYNYEFIILEKNDRLFEMHEELGEVDLYEFNIPASDSTDNIDIFLYNYIDTGEIDTSLLDLQYIYNNPSVEYMCKLPLVILLCRNLYNNKIGKSMVGYEEMFTKKIL